MPRENRKRGKKHKKPQAEEEEHYEEPQPVTASHDEQAEASTSTQDAPFGFVDPDVKAYFRTVDAQLKEWQDDFGDVEEGMDLMEGASAVPCVRKSLSRTLQTGAISSSPRFPRWPRRSCKWPQIQTARPSSSACCTLWTTFSSASLSTDSADRASRTAGGRLSVLMPVPASSSS